MSCGRCAGRCTVAAGFVVFALAAAAGCTSDGADTPRPSCEAYAVPSTFDAMAKTVSFRQTIVPIFEARCSGGACHGASTGTNNGIRLGGTPAPDPSDVRSDLIDKDAKRVAMRYVTPGDPAGSYLLRKIDGDQCALDEKCAAGTCLGPMPGDDDRLSEEERFDVRRWIAQGALDN